MHRSSNVFMDEPFNSGNKPANRAANPQAPAPSTTAFSTSTNLCTNVVNFIKGRHLNKSIEWMNQPKNGHGDVFLFDDDTLIDQRPGGGQCVDAHFGHCL